MKRSEIWSRLEANPLGGDYRYQIDRAYLLGGAYDRSGTNSISRAKLNWAREVIRCWWADRMPVPPEPK